MAVNSRRLVTAQNRAATLKAKYEKAQGVVNRLLAKPTFRIVETDAEFFKDVEFIVEADDYAQHALWLDFFHEPIYPVPGYIVKWEQVMSGHGVHIGDVDGRPTVVSLNYAILEGHRVMFYYGISQLVDHKMVEDWLHHWTAKTIRYDNGTRYAHCDATNFGHCLSFIVSMRKAKVANG